MPTWPVQSGTPPLVFTCFYLRWTHGPTTDGLRECWCRGAFLFLGGNSRSFSSPECRLQSFMRSCQPRASWQNPRVLWQSIAWKVMSPRPWQHAWQWHGITMASQEACTSFEALNFKLIPCASIVCYAWGRHLCWHLCKTLKLDGWRSTCNQKPGGTKSGKINRGSSSPCSTSVVKIGWYRIGAKIIETVCKLNTVYMIYI